MEAVKTITNANTLTPAALHVEKNTDKESASSLFVQCKLSVGAADDPLEKEADDMADKVMRMPNPEPIRFSSSKNIVSMKCAECEKEEELQRKESNSEVNNPTPDRLNFSRSNSIINRKCAHCEEEEKQLQRKESNGESVSVAPSIVHDVIDSSGGRSMDADTRSFMESRFSYDFSNVKIHDNDLAAKSASSINALAYTSGNNIVFNSGQYNTNSDSGKRLLAHELTHTLQQRSLETSTLVQRDEFGGAAGRTARDIDRPLEGYAGPLPYTSEPGGTVVPNTASTAQNCAGDTCNVNRYINWPYLGVEVSNMVLPGGANWNSAVNFVPSGCTRVNCTGIDENNTRCRSGELEAIVFLYRWPVQVRINNQIFNGTQSDFHMIGRNTWPGGWHSKMDRRERVIDIRNPWQSLYNAYPRTRRPDHIIQQLCFCCNQSAITII